MRGLAMIVLVGVVSGCVSVSVGPTALPSIAQSPVITMLPPIVTLQPATPTAPAQSTPPPQPTPAATPTPTVEPTASPTRDPNATPRPTKLDIAPYLTSEITVVNLFDESASVGVVILDAESDDTFSLGEFGLEPLQVTTQAVVPARYLLHFYLGAGFNIASCAIDIAENEQVQFAVIEAGVAIATSGEQPADPEEMLVGTSSRCRAEEI